MYICNGFYNYFWGMVIPVALHVIQTGTASRMRIREVCLVSLLAARKDFWVVVACWVTARTLSRLHGGVDW